MRNTSILNVCSGTSASWNMTEKEELTEVIKGRDLKWTKYQEQVFQSAYFHAIVNLQVFKKIFRSQH